MSDGTGEIPLITASASNSIELAQTSQLLSDTAKAIEAEQKALTVYNKAVDAEHLEQFEPKAPVRPKGVDEGAKFIGNGKVPNEGNDPVTLEHPAGSEHKLPDRENPNFSGKPISKILPPGTKIYRVIEEDETNDIKVNGRYWLYRLPSSKVQWRSLYAVKGWNKNGYYVEHEVGAEGLPVWEGKAASQSYKEKGEDTWAQSGGGTQIFVPSAQGSIPANLPLNKTGW